MKENFINRYPLSKTLRFSLLPIGKTEENFIAKRILDEDKQRAEDYEKVKEYIDRYHRSFIDDVLKKVSLSDVKEYAQLYQKKNRTDADAKAMKALEAKMRKEISKAFTSDERYKKLWEKELIRDNLPAFLTDEEEKKAVASFESFTTYFKGFYENRKNMYSEEDKSTSISNRCINDNLPRFLDNIKSFEKVSASLPKEDLTALNDDMYSLFGNYVSDVFSLDYFDFVLPQSGIDVYNAFIGGYSCEDGTKIKGINEYINLYNQQVAKNDKSMRLPFMKTLKKQILSEKTTVSFVSEKFSTDDEVLCAVNEYYNNHKDDFSELSELFSDFASYNAEGIYIKNSAAISEISKAVFDDWSAIKSAWSEEYERNKPIKSKTDIEKYEDKKQKVYKAIQSFSIYQLHDLMNRENNSAERIMNWYSESVAKAVEDIYEAYSAAESLLTEKYEGKYDKKLYRNESATEKIKKFLDSVKELELFVKPLLGTGKEEIKDETFYGKFVDLFDSVSTVDKLYDKVRNYMTQKPYSKDKIKLNFDNPQLLGGWDKNKESDYRTVILRKNNLYYLAIMDKAHSKVFVDLPEVTDGNCYEKMEYKLLPGPNKMLPKVFFASSNYAKFEPSDRILNIRTRNSFKKGNTFNINECHEFIDFFKSSIQKHEDWSKFGFEFTDTEKYNDISEFYREVSEQGYSLNFCSVSAKYIDSLVENGYIYLFQIYNKDFSERSHGTPNLHTLYFKMLFDKQNLSDVVYKLNGEAEMFYREASINDKEKIVHYANVPIENKNPNSKNSESTFEYDIIKDRRFTKRQFALHVPITINFKANSGAYINVDVRKAVKDRQDNYVIGIDRGERNLIYICVVNSRGDIIEQYSLNEIINDNGYKVDYQRILDERGEKIDEERKSWKTVENIKELKEGYLSQVVHKICELVIKYDAVIAMEDLNFGFKKGRFKVEKQVYQKFENMLTSKLNLLIDKKAEYAADGGLLKAYQLTNKVDGVNKSKQNGIIFYVPAWCTSKIDPATGFVNLLRPKYTSVAESKKLFGTMDDIRYNRTTDMFEFDIDYDKFPKCNSDYKKMWTVCTNGDRIKTSRNKNKNSEWDNERIILTDEFKKLFAEYGIDYSTGIKEAISENSNAEFHRRLVKLLALTLQMRNSVTGSTLPEDDFLISPVANKNGESYDSRNYKGENAALPCDADANGAYNIARKALWAIDVLKNTPDEELDKANLAISNAEWLKYTQK